MCACINIFVICDNIFKHKIFGSFIHTQRSFAIKFVKRFHIGIINVAIRYMNNILVLQYKNIHIYQRLDIIDGY